MNDRIVHVKATRSWWDGSMTALCGAKLDKPERILLPSLSGYTKCPACMAAKRR